MSDAFDYEIIFALLISLLESQAGITSITYFNSLSSSTSYAVSSSESSSFSGSVNQLSSNQELSNNKKSRRRSRDRKTSLINSGKLIPSITADSGIGIDRDLTTTPDNNTTNNNNRSGSLLQRDDVLVSLKTSSRINILPSSSSSDHRLDVHHDFVGGSL